MNYIHEIDAKVKKSAIDGVENTETLYNAVIEISNGDNVKYEIHPDGKYLTAVRTLSPIFTYPFSYGFIPQTLGEDGDGLDVIVVTPTPLAHLSVVEVRILGYVPTIDNGARDDKIIAVPAYSSLKKVSMDKIMAFLKNYKYPNNQNTKVGEFVADPIKAMALIDRARAEYERVYRIPPMNTPVEPDIKPVQPEKEEVLVSTQPQETPVKIPEQPVEQEEVVEEKVSEESMENTVQEISQEPLQEEVVAENSAPFLEENNEADTETVQQEQKEIDTGWLT